ncbi:MAG: HD domain-containing phosphohydrolase [Sphingomonadaceae bacterium]
MTPTADLSLQAPPGATLLCVEAQPAILDELRQLLQAHGYRVLGAGSGADAQAQLEQELPDLILCGRTLPDVDGITLLTRVRQRWPAPLRLLLTGHADSASLQTAINNGDISRYITTPWHAPELLLVVQHALERRQLEREKQALLTLTRDQNEQLRTLNASLEAQVEARTQQLRKEHELAVAANDKLKHNFITTIKVLSCMVEMRGHYVPGHSRQVAELARQLAVKLGLDSQAVQQVFIAGLLHDIGKIGFSDAMLTLPLTAMHGEQLALYRQHPQRAEELLTPLEDLHGSAAILRAQLERFDGKGFPFGKSGPAIPLGARILALAVDYFSLQQGAVVQRQLHPEEAHALILESSGKRYDPDVVQAFLSVVPGQCAPGIEAGVARLSSELRPGMVLARDLVNRDGMMLLTADHVLEARMIQHVRDIETQSGHKMTLWIRPEH